MVLKDVHPDIERYLYEDCYCPGEIYDTTGFFFQVFKADEECKEIYRGKAKANPDDTVAIVVCRNQIITFWINNDKVVAAERYDATENNLRVIPALYKGELAPGDKLNEFKPGETAKALNEILSISDGLIVS